MNMKQFLKSELAKVKIWRLAILVLILGFIWGHSSVYVEKAGVKKEVFLYEPILRVLTQVQGVNYTTCSAVVISQNLAFSAAHCFDMPPVPQYISDENEKHIVPVQVYFLNAYRDLVLITGDFSKFKKMQVAQTPVEINQKLLSCGFPYNGKKVCSKLEVLAPYKDLVSFKGFMYSGMSGGPIYDVETQTVFAINHGLQIGFVVGSPVVNFINFDL